MQLSIWLGVASAEGRGYAAAAAATDVACKIGSQTRLTANVGQSITAGAAASAEAAMAAAAAAAAAVAADLPGF